MPTIWASCDYNHNHNSSQVCLAPPMLPPDYTQIDPAFFSIELAIIPPKGAYVIAIFDRNIRRLVHLATDTYEWERGVSWPHELYVGYSSVATYDYPFDILGIPTAADTMAKSRFMALTNAALAL